MGSKDDTFFREKISFVLTWESKPASVTSVKTFVVYRHKKKSVKKGIANSHDHHGAIHPLAFGVIAFLKRCSVYLHESLP